MTSIESFDRIVLPTQAIKLKEMFDPPIVLPERTC